MKSVITFSTVFALILSASCMQRSALNETKHDLGRATNDTNRYQWWSTNDNEYFTFLVSKHSELKGSKFYDSKNPVVVRLQSYIDAIDSMVRKNSSTRNVEAPRPFLKVANLQEKNAFVDTVPICINLRIRFQNQGTESVDDIYFNRMSGKFEAWDGMGSPDCISPNLSLEELSSYLDWILSPFTSDCSMKTQRDGTAEISGNCVGNSTFMRNVIEAKRLIVQATSNQITAYSGLLDFLDEDEVVSVLAHELGHYYMSHITTPASQYGQFYFLSGRKNPGEKPRADDDAERLGYVLMTAIRKVQGLDAFTVVDNQTFHSVVFSAISGLAPALRYNQCGATGSACASPCSALSDLVTSSDVKTRLGNFPQEPLESDDQLKIYFQYEDTLRLCAKDVLLPSVPKNPSPAIEKVAPGFGNIDQDKVILYFSRAFGSRIVDLITSDSLPDTLYALISRISNDLFRLLRDSEALEVEAIGRGLAWYTIEQEADEIGLEMISRLGLEPSKMVSQLIKFGHLPHHAGDLSRGEVGAEDCETLAANGWKDHAGKYVFVPVANWLDLHHSQCFRAFNAWRETQVHDYNSIFSRTTKRVQSGATTWKKLIDENL